jgi:hypothetical protein
MNKFLKTLHPGGIRTLDLRTSFFGRVLYLHVDVEKMNRSFHAKVEKVLFPGPNQACQMVYFQTKKSQFG